MRGKRKTENTAIELVAKSDADGHGFTLSGNTPVQQQKEDKQSQMLGPCPEDQGPYSASWSWQCS